MSISYKWKIERIEAAPKEGSLDDVVKSVCWRLYATDSATGTVIDAWGVVDLPEADPTNFVSYSELTEGDVTAWVEAVLDTQEVYGDEPNFVTQMKTNLARRLAEKVSPAKVEAPLPWA
jgi:hypothetical protein